ncbi:MAG: hypothetical protein Q9227_007789 [Pyrenula ochraceoflavens]
MTTGMESANGTSKPSKLHFVIIGGSLGGLAAGLALKSLGHDTTILERNPTPLLDNQGAGIVAGGDTLAFFKRYNRCDRPIAVSSQCRLYLDKEGNVIHKKDMVQNMTSWDLAYYLMRANYDGVKSDYCTVPPPDPSHGKATHLHDHNVTDFTIDPSTNKVHVSYKTSSGTTGTITGDTLIGADGPSSTIRNHLLPTIRRTYSGYCALRGTLPEHSASPSTLSAFRERFTFFHGPGRQILAYLIPGPHGTVQPGHRLINFVYYTNFPEASPELEEIMTDRHGKRHLITMPPGLTSQKAWDKQKQLARENLPPQFAEIVCATPNPFVQAVTDVLSTNHTFYDDKVILIGDALAGFRPHTVASTSQAAFDAMRYADFVAGGITREEWRRETMGFARFVQRRGVEMGRRSQFGFEEVGVEGLIGDRDRASVPRQEEVWPEWAVRVED